ncbi:MAG: NAD(P)/FAD-dependent oxidoreductase [Firmicutes bacterium HGW-Firmicutes-14]|nr:MAG: NAD(P)/FAD-dependent oxidoreductase [Firmicutes bacterium HGW-Firmicutes-14]
MDSKSIIIIGGGLAGLSAGCYAQMNGYSSGIFELHSLPGGVCTAWKRHGYTMDSCIHWLMSCKPGSSFYPLYRELGVMDGSPIQPITEFASFLDEKTGQTLSVTSDLNKLGEDMKSISPEDTAVIDELIRCSKALQGFDSGIPKPPELSGAADTLKMLWKFRRVLKYLFRYGMPVEELAGRFNHPFLQQCIKNIFLPTMPAYFLFAILGQLADGQLCRYQGGSLSFSEAIAARYADLGGTVTYNTEVAEILVEDDTAVGIRLSDGTEHRADIVISAADGHSTIFNMLGGRYIDTALVHRYDNWPLFSGLIICSFGVARSFAGESPAKTILLDNPLDTGCKRPDSLLLRILNYDPSLAPDGKTVVQVVLESDFDYWNELYKDNDRYTAQKTRISNQVLAWLESLYPGVTSQVEVADAATPYTYWRYTRNFKGSYEGWMMTPETIRTQIPKTLPGLKSFYMAGQWVEPGGGIPPALYSGRNVIQIICKQDGKRFTAVRS